MSVILEYLVPKRVKAMVVRQQEMSLRRLYEVPEPDMIMNEAEAAEYQKICEKMIQKRLLQRYMIHVIMGTVMYQKTLQRQREVIQLLPVSTTKRERKFLRKTALDCELIWLDFGLTPDDFKEMDLEWPGDIKA
ncbi:MAG: hypothetical protein JJU13_10325 [Balneolaceae bacterium]|nr:hypothetical protein [Balneolaceae bacterium]